MMHYKKHLNQKAIKICLVAAFIVFNACSKEVKKNDFVARVNESYLTREVLASLADTNNISDVQKDQLIKNWIYSEVLFQKAKDEGITESDSFKIIINKSTRELAAALLLENFVDAQKIDYDENDLKQYYDKNSNYFKLNSNHFLINRVYFYNEDAGIKFRTYAQVSDWKKAVTKFLNDSLIIKNVSQQLADINEIYPLQLARIIGDFQPQEISIVIADKPGYYSVVQLVEKISKGSVPSFEVIKDKVEKRFLAEKKKYLTESFIKELYTQNDIEIRK